MPDVIANRLKLGFTTSIQDRLDSYRTLSPTAAVVKSWRCKPTWERCAIDSITRVGVTQLGIEVYDCDDLPALIERAEQFFALMPSLE